MLGTSARAETYPPGWEHYILLDQLSNVPTRKNAILTAEQSAIVPVYHIDVPYSQTMLTRSKFLEDSTLKRVLIEKPDGVHYRIFFTETPGVPHEQIKKLGYPVESTHWGTKMQSHSTFLVWEKENTKPEPFFLKMSSPHWVEKGVRNGEMAETILRETGTPFGTLFPERLSLRLTGMEFGYAIREAKPTGMSPTAELAPVHGILGSKSDMAELAKARGLKNAGEWIKQEYLPKLAQFLSQMQFRNGLFLPAHSQNLVLQLNRRTGKIEGFVGRDLVDTILDPFVPAWRGKGIRSAVSVLHESYVDGTDSKYPGPHLAGFAAQSVVDASLDPAERRTYSADFLESYIRAAEKETGMKFKLSESAAAALASLKAGHNPGPHAYSKDIPEPEATFALIGAEVYSRVAESRARRRATPLLNAKARALVEATFWEHHYKSKVVYLKPNGWKLLRGAQKLEFTITDTGVFAFEKGNPDPIAFAAELQRVYRDAVIAANREPADLGMDETVSSVLPRCRGAARALR